MNEWKSYLAAGAQTYGINLTAEQLDKFERYQKTLLDWNTRMNLTAITEPKAVADRHFIDSLLLLKAVDLPHGAALADIGTGAGFPAIPAAILRPDLRITLVDSLQKRLRFLEALCAELGIQAEFVHGRAEDLGRNEEHRERYDIVTARAVARLRELSEWCLPFVRTGGIFAALKGGEVEEEVQEAAAAIRILGGKQEQAEHFTLPDGSERTIITVQKISQTPSQYPRTVVKMTKNPLK